MQLWAAGGGGGTGVIFDPGGQAFRTQTGSSGGGGGYVEGKLPVRPHQILTVIVAGDGLPGPLV